MRVFPAVLCALAVATAPTAFAKGSCCSHPAASVYIAGPTVVPGLVQPGQTALLNVALVVRNGGLTSVAVAPGSAFSLVSTTCKTVTSCTAVVAFKPTEGGNYAGTITAHASNAYGAGAASSVLTGTGYGANYAWSAPVITSVTAGATGSVELSLQSIGQTPLTIQGLTLSPSPYLTLGANTCTGPIAVGSSCSVTVNYNASLVETDATAYLMSGTLSVVSPNSATNALGSVSITAFVPQGDTNAPDTGN